MPPKGWKKKKEASILGDPLDPPIGSSNMDDDPREEVPLGPSEAKPEAEPIPRKPRKSKKGKPVPVEGDMIEAGADFVLDGASQAYQMFRGKPLLYDAKRKQTFAALLGRWAEEEGLELPLWVQVTVAGAACIIPAIVAAEMNLAKPTQAGAPAGWQDASLESANRRPSPEVSRAPADNGGGEAGERKDVVA
jgi:hypothetical protein